MYDIQLPDNKSLKIRRMLSAYVLRGEIPPECGTDCHDVQLMCRALRTIADAQHRSAHAKTVVDVEDCGAAYRFLLPLLAFTPGNWLLTGTPRLLQRPIEPLVTVLSGIGAEIQKVDDGWLIHGRPSSSVETQIFASLQHGETGTRENDGLSLTLDASLSSQMASALVLSAPLLGLTTLHLTTTDIPSLSYLRMTLACTKEYPVAVPGITVPDTPIGALGDWSAALFWFSYARLHPEREFRLHPLTVESVQPDSVIAQWFGELGVSVKNDGSSVCIRALPLDKKSELVLDVRDNLDTVPVMAALACLLPADITFENVENLRYKESDRLQALCTQLAPFAEIALTDRSLRVVGKGIPAGGDLHVDTHHDHRLALAFLLFGPQACINDTVCLRKSYPRLLRQLGG